MASCLFLLPVPVNHLRHRRMPPNHKRSATAAINLMSFSSSSSSEINLHRSFPLVRRNSTFHRCYATSSPSEPPPDDQIPPTSGVSPKDTLQIFFAVLFWMSLFFWSCAWDQGNSGRPDKGSRFWK